MWTGSIMIPRRASNGCANALPFGHLFVIVVRAASQRRATTPRRRTTTAEHEGIRHARAADAHDDGGGGGQWGRHTMGDDVLEVHDNNGPQMGHKGVGPARAADMHNEVTRIERTHLKETKDTSKEFSKTPQRLPKDSQRHPETPGDIIVFHDGSPKYSGTEIEMPIACFPHLLRPMRLGKAKAAGKNKAAPKPSSKKCLCPSTDEDKGEDYNSEVSMAIPKKTLKQSDTGGGHTTDKPAAPHPLPPKLAASTLKQLHAGDRSTTDKVAEMLFSTTPTRHKQVAVQPASRSSTPPLPTAAPPAPIPSAPAPPPTSAQMHFPQQQAMD
ncbi:hypothetical protein BJ912DRAFT_930769 [Pholiota molesta]|nr:hypothetical protein BJ912DRAFT_930769 [Pholiota molesta]